MLEQVRWLPLLRHRKRLIRTSGYQRNQSPSAGVASRGAIQVGQAGRSPPPHHRVGQEAYERPGQRCVASRARSQVIYRVQVTLLCRRKRQKRPKLLQGLVRSTRTLGVGCFSPVMHLLLTPMAALTILIKVVDTRDQVQLEGTATLYLTPLTTVKPHPLAAAPLPDLASPLAQQHLLTTRRLLCEQEICSLPVARLRSALTLLLPP